MSHESAVVASPSCAGPVDLPGAALDYARRFWYAMRRWWWSSYWRLEVEGLEHVPRRGPSLLCPNHASHLDAPAVLAALPRELALRASTAAAKDAFGDHKWRDIVSRVIANAMPIERGAGFSRGLRQLEAVLYDNRPLILFPEGRRSTDGKLAELKPGAAMLALRTGILIIPVHIAGADGSLPRGGHFPRPHDVRVRFGKPIDPRPYAEAVAAGRLRKREAYEQLTARLKSDITALPSAVVAASTHHRTVCPKEFRVNHAPERTALRRAAAAAVLPLAVLAGCESTGLSPREAAGRNFSSYVYSLDTPAPAPDAAPAKLVLPTNLAVAQVGEVAPPTSFLNKLRTSRSLFSRVEGISGAVGIEPAPLPRRADSTITAESQAQREVARIQRVARDMGMDHLLLVGGTIDQVTKENGLSVLDLTLIGAFVVPSKQIDAEARASAALIDLASGRVVLFASADASKARVASSVTRQSGEIDVMRDARDEVLAKLAAQVIEQCDHREQAKSSPAN